MEKEIELKILLPEGINEASLLSVLKGFAANIETSEFTLFNQYFDTPEWALSAHNIGLRVRSSEKGIEQTVKTAGRTVGGLHQRPEYNVAIDSLDPDLELFPADIWPESLSVSELQENIVQIFHTDFRRLAHLLRLSDGTDVELVFDKGDISTADNQTEICELELELKRGDIAVLFELAEKITSIAPTQLCNISKAGRGFLLARKALAPASESLGYVSLERGDTCEQAFVKALEYGLSFWQKAEYRYRHRRKIADLFDIHIGLKLTAACVNLYSDVLNAEELLDLRNALKLRLRKWAWIEQLRSIKSLRSKRGMYSKRLVQHAALISYLRGLQDGTLNLSRPDFLITHSDNTLLQLRLSKLLITKPWRQNNQRSKQNIRELASDKLAEIWQRVFESINGDSLTSQSYLQFEPLLDEALLVDRLVGDAFSSSKREAFCAPWQDIYEGMQELRTLNVLQNKLQDSDMENKTELLQWSELKKSTLVSVIKQSTLVAWEVEPYW
ncbi:inorganic triphosphatase [Aliiglaciecola litoralis]|uniref:Inorganic triphosphatase n=1 Tax=Aliiglaciecola litoralis TaxID=582857 RepID=A0ABN1LE89_9ALTE